MPTLSFPGHDFDAQYLHALMAHPNDDAAQGELIAVGWANSLAAGLAADSKVTLPAGVIKVIVSSDSYATLVNKASRQVAKGEMAGSLLVNLARMNLSGSSYCEKS